MPTRTLKEACAQGLSGLARSPCSQAAEASSTPQQAFNAPSLRVRQGRGVCFGALRVASGRRGSGKASPPMDACMPDIGGHMRPRGEAALPNSTQLRRIISSCSSGAGPYSPSSQHSEQQQQQQQQQQLARKKEQLAVFVPSVHARQNEQGSGDSSQASLSPPLCLQAPTAFGLNAGSIASSLRASAAASPFSAAPAMQQRSNMSILAASKMVGAGCATIALAGEQAGSEAHVGVRKASTYASCFCLAYWLQEANKEHWLCSARTAVCCNTDCVGSQASLGSAPVQWEQ